MDHALLSPSGASRWIACTPSARLELQFEDESSVYADEGTLAHSLGELMIKEKRKVISKTFYKQELKKIQADKLYSAEMLDFMDQYSDNVIELFNELRAKDPHAFILQESKVDLSAYIPEGYGTTDNALGGGNMLYVVDLKYGKGVEVSAVDNSQLKIYALGVLDLLDWVYDFEFVTLYIFQPRIDNYSAYTLSTELLRHWAEAILKPAAEKAFAGEGVYVPGEHCRFCRARPTCRAHATQQLEIAKYEFKAADLLSDDEVSDVLNRIDGLKSWATEIAEYALTEAISKGKKWPDYKLVAGRSVRVYTDPEAIKAALIAGQVKPEYFLTEKLNGITELEKNLGKSKVAELIGEYIAKPDGKPTLVPVSDKRPELDKVTSAQNDFKTDLL